MPKPKKRQPNSYVNRGDVERAVRADRRTPTGFEVTYLGRSEPVRVESLDKVRWDNVTRAVVLYAKWSRSINVNGDGISVDRTVVRR